MSRILMTSELGAGYGHLAKIRLLAKAFSHLGHWTAAAHPDVGMLRQLGEEVTIYSTVAPQWATMPVKPGPAVSYAEILERIGYCIPGRVPEMIERWLAVFSETKPDLVTADHAPTAMLAARCAGLPCVRIGTGFQAPPAQAPLPSLLTSSRSTAQERRAVESRVLEMVNGAFQAFGLTTVESLSSALAPDEEFLCTFPELDHYPRPGHGRYWGPLFLRDEGQSPDWPAGPGPKIFAYVAGRMVGLGRFCQSLQALGIPTLVHARGLSLIERARLQSKWVRLVAGPLCLREVVSKSRLLICHGSHGFTIAALLGGKPLVVAPQHVEQLMLARRLVEQGFALVAVDGGPPAHTWATTVTRVLESPTFEHCAKVFAERHRGYDPRTTAMEVAEHCTKILSSQSISVPSK